jgi:hypothetical protein
VQCSCFTTSSWDSSGSRGKSKRRRRDDNKTEEEEEEEYNEENEYEYDDWAWGSGCNCSNSWFYATFSEFFQPRSTSRSRPARIVKISSLYVGMQDIKIKAELVKERVISLLELMYNFSIQIKTQKIFCRSCNRCSIPFSIWKFLFQSHQERRYKNLEVKVKPG